jgi:hypothetical protein
MPDLARESVRLLRVCATLTITDPWLKVFTAGYVLVGIGILVEIARRLGMGFIAARAEMEEAKATATSERAIATSGAGMGTPPKGRG